MGVKVYVCRFTQNIWKNETLFLTWEYNVMQREHILLKLKTY